MLSTKEFNRLLKLGNQISKLTTDEERLKFCRKNPKDVVIKLDNAYTLMEIKGSYNGEQQSLINEACADGRYFKYCYGDDLGVILVFNFIGITAEGV